LAFAISGVPGPREVFTRWWPVLVLFAAIAPDLDFLPGILIGDPNRFHHGPSHSIAAAVVFTMVLALIFRSLSKVRVFVIFAVYLGHVLVDTLAADPGAPYGAPLLWPFDDHYTIAPVTLFSNFGHGAQGAGLGSVIRDIFSVHNLWAVAIEVAILGPLLWLTERYRRRRRSS
jgi:inner membrane protein|tara:strand:- start:11536 stop:12054 length:519 start_codon:yes stop_codon:yes gene_type:complete